MAARPRHVHRPSSFKCHVWALQCLGLYCFKKAPSTAVADSMEISLPLLLWTIILKAYQVIFSVFAGFQDEEHDPHDVGTLMTKVNEVTSTVFLLLGQSSLLMNGKELCQILSRCDEDTSLKGRKDASCSVMIFSTEGIVTLFFYCSYVAGTFLPFILLGLSPNGDVLKAAAFYVFYATISSGMMVTTTLFRKMLASTSSTLNADFLRDESFLRGGVAGPGLRLDTLERMIRKVELLREKIVDVFLIDISLVMCSCTITAITYMNITIRSILDGIPDYKPYSSFAFVYFALAITTILHLCYSAHHFSREVHGVSTKLRDLRLEVHDEGSRVQLHYLISTLETMETFDMGSWYHLGPNTFISVGTFVVTYLVVLLQVGNMKTRAEPSTKANTSAV